MHASTFLFAAVLAGAQIALAFPQETYLVARGGADHKAVDAVKHIYDAAKSASKHSSGSYVKSANHGPSHAQKTMNDLVKKKGSKSSGSKSSGSKSSSRTTKRDPGGADHKAVDAVKHAYDAAKSASKHSSGSYVKTTNRGPSHAQKSMNDQTKKKSSKSSSSKSSGRTTKREPGGADHKAVDAVKHAYDAAKSASKHSSGSYVKSANRGPSHAQKSMNDQTKKKSSKSSSSGSKSSGRTTKREAEAEAEAWSDYLGFEDEY